MLTGGFSWHNWADGQKRTSVLNRLPEEERENFSRGFAFVLRKIIALAYQKAAATVRDRDTDKFSVNTLGAFPVCRTANCLMKLGAGVEQGTERADTG
jgi:hypothetical protein